MRLLYNNLFDSAALTSDNTDPNYPLSAMQEIHLSEAFRFADTSGGYIDIDLGSAQAASAIAITGNLSASATITLKGNSSESWAAPPVDESITAADRNLLHYFTESTYRYWRLEIADSGNPDGYIEISRVFLGTYLDMPDPENEYSYELESLSSREFSPTGQPFSVQRPERAIYSFVFPPTFDNDDRAALVSAYKSVGIHKPVFLDVWTDDWDTEEPLYVLFEPNSIRFTKFQRGKIWSLDIDFIESR